MMNTSHRTFFPSWYTTPLLHLSIISIRPLQFTARITGNYLAYLCDTRSLVDAYERQGNPGKPNPVQLCLIHPIVPAVHTHGDAHRSNKKGDPTFLFTRINTPERSLTTYPAIFWFILTADCTTPFGTAHWILYS